MLRADGNLYLKQNSSSLKHNEFKDDFSTCRVVKNKISVPQEMRFLVFFLSFFLGILFLV